MKRPARMLHAAIAAAVLALASPLPAIACGGLFCMNVSVDQAGERILFAADGQQVVAHVQIQYQGPAEDFSWIVPVPTEPKLSVGSDMLFQRLREATRPQFRLNWKSPQGTCEEMPPMPTAAAMPSPAASAGSGVSVVSQEQVGPFDAAVIQANDPAALKNWLTTNKYVIPPAIDPLLDPYVAGKYYFIALKLRKNADAGDLQPIVFKYAATKPGIPIRLTGVAATPDMGVWVWVLGKHRAVPENYRHAAINEARIDWLGGGGNYPQVVTEAMNEAGGQAFVTDFAGASDQVDATAFDPAAYDLAAVRGQREPIAFARAVVDGGYFGGRAGSIDGAKLVAFLKRYVPKPAALKDVPDLEFYRFIENYSKEMQQAQVSVDAAAAAAELEEKVVKPMGEIRALFRQHGYLSAMYTTMSPDEMSTDPLFVFNPDLPKVSNIHEAEAQRICSKGLYEWQAPVRITLADGLSYMMAIDGVARPGGLMPSPSATGASAQPLAMPAASRIEQLKTSGAPSLIRDNKAQIRKAMADARVLAEPTAATKPAGGATASAGVAIDPGSGKTVAVPVGGAATAAAGGGFGCAGCASPSRAPVTGAGEGLTFALFLAGWLGYRRFRR